MQLSDRVAILGGADPRNPREPDHHLRHLFVGTLLLAVAVWAFLGTTEAFHTMLPLPLAAVVGLVIAVVVLCVDVLITVSPLAHDTVGHRVQVLVARGLISLAMGMVIGLSTIMYMYQGSIAQIMSGRNEAAAAAAARTVTASSQWPAVISADKGKIANAQTRIQNDNAEIKNAQGHLASLNEQWLNDQVCLDGGRRAADGNTCGDGPVTTQLKQEISTYQNYTLPGIEQTDNADIKAADSEISQLNGEVASANAKLSAQVTDGTKDDLADTDLAAQANALVTLLGQDKLVWVWPIFFFAVDLAVALMKALLPESGFDRRRREARQREDDISTRVAASAEWDRVAEHKARREADVMIARIDADADREIAAAWSGADSLRAPYALVRGQLAGDEPEEQDEQDLAEKAGTGPRTPPARKLATRSRRRPLRRRPRAWTVAGVAVVALLAGTPVLTRLVSPTGPSLTAFPGQSISLNNGEKLTIPLGATSGNAAVTATYTSPDPWAGYSPASEQVTLTSHGKLVGQPVLSLPVTGNLATAAGEGALVVAYKTDAGWEQYPEVSYNPKTHTMDAALTHFSTWRFWTADWAVNLASITQSIGQWEGRRAAAPGCNASSAELTRYVASSGSGDSSGLPVLGCVQKEPGGALLDVELVNNRPYGLMLHYDGAAVKSGTHAPPSTLIGVLQDAVGDYGAGTTDSLYLPPLSDASVEVPAAPGKKSVTFTITPTPATVLADALSMSVSPLVQKGVMTAAAKWGQGVIAAAASRASCAQFLAAYPVTSAPDRSTVMDLLTSKAPECIKDILALAAGNDGTALGTGTVGVVAAADGAMDTIIDVGKWADVAEKLGKVLDFVADDANAILPGLGLDLVAL